MKLFLLLSVQAAAASAPQPSTVEIKPIDFDLAKAVRAIDRGVHGLFSCDRSGGDVVVCGRRAGPAYPLEEMARIFEAKPIRADVALGNGMRGNVHVQQVDLGGNNPSAHSGLTSNRVMVGLKLPF